MVWSIGGFVFWLFDDFSVWGFGLFDRLITTTHNLKPKTSAYGYVHVGDVDNKFKNPK